MGSTGAGVLGLIAGVIIGGIGATMLAGGAMMGAGAGAGIMTGTCSTVMAGKELGLLDDAQIDAVLARMAQDLGADAAELKVKPGQAASDCSAFMAKYVKK